MFDFENTKNAFHPFVGSMRAARIAGFIVIFGMVVGSVPYANNLYRSIFHSPRAQTSAVAQTPACKSLPHDPNHSVGVTMDGSTGAGISNGMVVGFDTGISARCAHNPSMKNVAIISREQALGLQPAR